MNPVRWATVTLMAGCVLAAGCLSPTTGVFTDREISAAASRGRRAFAGGYAEVAAKAYRQALMRARLLNDTAAVADCAYNLAACLTELGRYDEARRHLREARGVWSASGRDSSALAEAWLLEAKILEAEDAGDEAACALEAALKSLPPKNHGPVRSQIYAMQADLACAAGNLAAAREALRLARRTASSGRRLSTPALALIEAVEGRVLLAESRPAEAAARLQHAAEHFQQARRYLEMAEALLEAARAYDVAGQPGQAAELYLQAAASRQARGDLVIALKIITAAVAAAEKTDNAALHAQVRAIFEEIRDRTEQACTTQCGR